jgi:hypothetical protein
LWRQYTILCSICPTKQFERIATADKRAAGLFVRMSPFFVNPDGG